VILRARVIACDVTSRAGDVTRAARAGVERASLIHASVLGCSHDERDRGAQQACLSRLSVDGITGWPPMLTCNCGICVAQSFSMGYVFAYVSSGLTALYCSRCRSLPSEEIGDELPLILPDTTAITTGDAIAPRFDLPSLLLCQHSLERTCCHPLMFADSFISVETPPLLARGRRSAAG
jgi:hypothetical protein